MGKKIQKKIKNAGQALLEADLRSAKIKKIFLVGFLIFCVSYTGLIYLVGEQMKKEKIFQEQAPPSVLEQKISKMVEGYPISRMVPFISKRDQDVASYLIAIAKKESDWGKYSPKKDGKECFNYWGYRGTYNQTDSGYSCFRSPAQAVGVVGDRIKDLINQNIDTPKEMVVWKCGSDCSVFSDYSVDKWISDVDLYMGKIEENDQNL